VLSASLSKLRYRDNKLFFGDEPRSALGSQAAGELVR